MRKITAVVFFSISLLFIAQCGLERPLSAWDQPVAAGTAGTTYKFKTSVNHLDDATRFFQGYEVYYKIRKDNDFTVEETNITDANQLEARGFKRLFDPETDNWAGQLLTMPLYKTTAGDLGEGAEYEITIDFLNIDTVVIEDQNPVPVTGLSYEMRRATHYETGYPDYGEYKRFSDFLPGDTDIPAGVVDGLAPGESTVVYIALYVFAYGKSISSQSFWRDIKSPPCFLFVNAITIKRDDFVL